MAADSGDAHGLERIKGSQAIPTVPYASRGAGLYSEVLWDPIASLRARSARTNDNHDGQRPVAPT